MKHRVLLESLIRNAFAGVVLPRMGIGVPSKPAPIADQRPVDRMGFFT